MATAAAPNMRNRPHPWRILAFETTLISRLSAELFQASPLTSSRSNRSNYTNTMLWRFTASVNQPFQVSYWQHFGTGEPAAMSTGFPRLRSGGVGPLEDGGRNFRLSSPPTFVATPSAALRAGSRLLRTPIGTLDSLIVSSDGSNTSD